MKTIYAEAQPGKVVLKEKEIPAPGKGEVLLKAKYSAMSPGTAVSYTHLSRKKLRWNCGRSFHRRKAAISAIVLYCTGEKSVLHGHSRIAINAV